MCTRLVYHGNNIITGFNFGIDLSVWNHRVIEEKERFYIGILRPDGIYHSYHGVNQNGNVGTLLYVHGNPAGAFRDSPDCITIADLAEQFIKAQISFDDALRIVKTKKICAGRHHAGYAVGCSRTSIDNRAGDWLSGRT